MAKKKQFVTAAAAFAVAASAVAPAITADAATQTVRLSSDYVRSGNLDAALDKEYKGSEIHWYKSSVDLNKLGVFQTAKGFVKGKGIKVEKSVRVLNFAQDIQPSEEIVLEQGVPASGLRIQPVLFADGNLYNKPVAVAGFNTDKVGEFEGTFTYANKAYGTVTKTVKYKVVATKVELTEVKSEVMDDVLSVTADVKNLKDGEKVELVIYAGRDMNAALPAVEAEVKDGKLTVKSGKLPAGNHSFILRSGEVKSEVMNFVVEAPMVKEVKAINATQVEVAFNKAVDPATLFANGVSGAFKAGATVTLTTIDGVASGALTGTLSADGQTLTITSASALSKRYDVVVDGIKTKDAKAFAKYNKVVEFAADTTAPMVVSTVKKTASTFTVKFSEPMNNLGSVSYKLADGTSVTATATGVQNNFVAGAQEVTFTVGSEVAAGKQVIATFVGAQDQALNIISPNPATVSFVKGDKDGVAPTVTSLVAVNNKTIEVKFSEELQANPSITGFAGTTLTFKQDASDKTKYTITSDTANTGLKAVSVDAGYTDLSGEAGAAYSKVLNFDVDTVAPKVASTKVVKVDGVEYLEVSFDEIVETAAALTTLEVTGTKVSNFVTSNITPVSVPVAKFVQVSTDKKSYRVTLADLLGTNSTKDASYSLDIAGNSTLTPVALVSDLSGNAGPSTFKANVVRSEDATAPSNTKASLDTSFSTNGIQLNADKTITVRFNQELDGASATNVANYKFDGAVVEKAVLSPVVAGKQDVTLTLKAGSNVFTGLRNVTVSGVKAKDGLVMDAVTTQETLVENVAPTVTAAKLTAPNMITLNFSENVYNVADAAGDDFELYVGGVKVTATLDTEDIAQVAAKNTLTLAIGAPGLTAEDLAKGLSIKSVNGLDIMDANDNVLSVGTVSVTQ